MASNEMSKVTAEPKLTTSDLHWMKQVEKQNLERVKKLKNTRSKNKYVALTLAAGVAAIYAYTIAAVKQETYFDDFEMPETVCDEE
uniref:Cytochrome c oxidase assembly factor 3 n=1 Tax=Bracon brevicornis TaxID=1563983 RepID=A0A6V7M2M1_9HYME